MNILPCGLLVALACQSAPAQDDQHLLVRHSTHEERTGDAPATGFAHLTVDDGDHGALSVTLQRDGTLSGELDGVPLPAERLVREGDRLRVRAPDGGTLYEVQVFGDNSGLGYPYGAGRHVWTGALVQTPWQGAGGGGPRRIIGVVTTPVDAALAAQLGLEPESAVMIHELTPGKPAEKAGLQPFDVITRIDGEAPVTRDSLRERVVATDVGKTLRLTVVRRGEAREVDVEVGETADGGSLLWSSFPGQVYDAVRERHEALERAQVELEKARESMGVRLDALQAAIERGGHEGEAAKHAAEELEAARRSVASAQDAMRQQSGVTPEVRFFDVGQGDKGLLLQQPAWRAEAQVRRRSPVPSADGREAEAEVDTRLQQMEERIAQLDARIAELVSALEAAKGQP